MIQIKTGINSATKIKGLRIENVGFRGLGMAEDTSRKRRMEIYAFLLVTAVLMPALTVAFVGTWGFTVWMYQIVNGPPGPPNQK